MSDPEAAYAAFVAGADPILRRDMAIGEELYHIFRRLGARSDLLAVVGSWTEGTLSADDLLVYLRAYNGEDRERIVVDTSRWRAGELRGITFNDATQEWEC